MPLFGLEGDVGNLGLNGIARSHAPFVSGDTSSRTEADFYLTARRRLGFVADHWLFYGTCGYFGAETRVAVIDACFIAPPCGHSTMDAEDRSFRSGWTAGGGIEWNFNGSWTAKAEYLYYDLGSTTVSGLAGGVGPTFSWDINTHGNIARAAINYKLTGFGDWRGSQGRTSEAMPMSSFAPDRPGWGGSRRIVDIVGSSAFTSSYLTGCRTTSLLPIFKVWEPLF